MSRHEGPRFCSECARELLSRIEHELCICNHCADRAYERELKHREFVHYHRGDDNGINA